MRDGWEPDPINPGVRHVACGTSIYLFAPVLSEEMFAARLLEKQLEHERECPDAYARLRAAVVEVLDAEIGDDVVALRQLLLDALDDENEVEFVEAMERVPVSANSACPCGGACDYRAGCFFIEATVGSPDGGTDG